MSSVDDAIDLDADDATTSFAPPKRKAREPSTASASAKVEVFDLTGDFDVAEVPNRKARKLEDEVWNAPRRLPQSNVHHQACWDKLRRVVTKGYCFGIFCYE